MKEKREQDFVSQKNEWHHIRNLKPPLNKRVIVWVPRKQKYFVYRLNSDPPIESDPEPKPFWITEGGTVQVADPDDAWAQFTPYSIMRTYE